MNPVNRLCHLSWRQNGSEIPYRFVKCKNICYPKRGKSTCGERVCVCVFDPLHNRQLREWKISFWFLPFTISPYIFTFYIYLYEIINIFILYLYFILPRYLSVLRLPAYTHSSLICATYIIGCRVYCNDAYYSDLYAFGWMVVSVVDCSNSGERLRIWISQTPPPLKWWMDKRNIYIYNQKYKSAIDS